jgi:hypothetical protein
VTVGTLAERPLWCIAACAALAVIAPGSAEAHAAQSVGDYAKHRAADRGWTGGQWRALQAIVRPESGWDPCAVYPARHDCSYTGTSSCGVPQAQPCPAAWRGRLWSVRFVQVRWLLDYIDRRYGDPLHALWFRQAQSYY